MFFGIFAMTTLSKIIRITVVLCSLLLIAAYVWHSHVSPNSPPPDPLGLSTIELTDQSADSELNPQAQPRSDLRIISSKVINQPIFSVRKRTQFDHGIMWSSSKSSILRWPTPSFSIHGGLPTFDLFGEHNTSTPPP